MDHQDWKPVILQKSPPVKHVQYAHVKEVDIDECRVKMVSPQLKRAFEQARLNSRDPRTGRCYTHERLANLINGTPKSIKQLETGKLSEKEAKKVALKVERVLKIKILEASSSHH